MNYCKKCQAPAESFKNMERFYSDWKGKGKINKFHCDVCHKDLDPSETYIIDDKILTQRFKDFKTAYLKKIIINMNKMWLRDHLGNTKIDKFSDGIGNSSVICPKELSVIPSNICYNFCSLFAGEGFMGEVKCRFFNLEEFNLKKQEDNKND